MLAGLLPGRYNLNYGLKSPFEQIFMGFVEFASYIFAIQVIGAIGLHLKDLQQC